MHISNINDLVIKHALPQHLDRIMELVAASQRHMRAQGNLTQWTGGYPSRDIMMQSIDSSELYVCLENDIVEGVFHFSTIPDPYYADIHNGEWINDEPYAVIHRLAGSGVIKGLGKKVIKWCGAQFPNIRIDTHSDNHPMLTILKDLDFIFCGIIHVADGTPRMAFQKIFK